MEFKIDTKPGYTVITPVSNLLDANLTAGIRQKWNELTKSGSYNIIVDLQNCLAAHETCRKALVALHEEVYNGSQSVVFTNAQNAVIEFLKENETDLQINMAPTINEAIDIVSMEVLERELFNEES